MPDFWDRKGREFLGGGGDYVSGDEKDALIASGQPFLITGVSKRNAFGQDQYALTVVLYNEETEEDEDRVMTFTRGGDRPVESRDNLLAAMMEEFESDPTAEPIKAKLTKEGNSKLIVPADDAEA